MEPMMDFYGKGMIAGMVIFAIIAILRLILGVLG